MKTSTSKTKIAATFVASLAALAGAVMAHGASSEPSLQDRVMELGRGARGSGWSNCPIAIANATAWAQGDEKEASTLHGEGFELGVRQLLRSNAGDLGVRVALRFRSPAGAEADVNRRELLAGQQGYPMNFAVPELPPCTRTACRRAGSTTVHVAFTRGTDEYAIVVETSHASEVRALEQHPGGGG